MSKAKPAAAPEPVTITEAGIYTDLRDPDYHAQLNWYSSSQIKVQIPEQFKAPASNDSVDFGSALHTYILGTGQPIAIVEAASWQGQAARDARAKAYADNEIPVLEKELPKIEAMAQAVHEHVEAAPLFSGPGRNELSIFQTIDGIDMKARLDRITDYGQIVDIKSTQAKPSRRALINAILDFGYDVSGDHYSEVARAAGLPVTDYLLVFVGKDAPHYVTVVRMKPDWFVRGRVLRQRALARIAGDLPPYEGAQDVLELELPKWGRIRD